MKTEKEIRKKFEQIENFYGNEPAFAVPYDIKIICRVLKWVLGESESL